MLSRPRKPPSNTLLPVRSWRFTHHVKLSSSLWNERSSQSKSPLPVRLFSSRYVKMVAHACTGGLTSPKVHSYAGICPLGGRERSRRIKSSCCFPETESPLVHARTREARSHAADPRESPLSRLP